MRIHPFYAQPDGSGPAVGWHDNDGCPIARSVPSAQRRPMPTGPAIRCPYCAMLATRPARATRVRLAARLAVAARFGRRGW